MRVSRYNYRRPPKEEDEEVPTETGNMPLTNKIRVSASQERASQSIGPPLSVTKALLPFQGIRAKKPTDKESPNRVFKKIESDSKLDSLASERDKHKLLKQKADEYKDIIKKFEEVKLKKTSQNNSATPDATNMKSHIVSTPDLTRKLPKQEERQTQQKHMGYEDSEQKSLDKSVELTGPRHACNKMSTDNPYKRKRSNVYKSPDRQKKLEQRRHRNSAKKEKQRELDPEADYSRRVNIDLFKEKIQPMDPSQSKKPLQVEVPVFHEDLEEITQTYENGVVVSESKRKISSGKFKRPTESQEKQVKVTASPYGQELEDLLNMNEPSESKDVTEEDIENEPRAQTQYLSSRTTKIAFDYRKDQNEASENMYKRQSAQIPQNSGASDPEPSNRESEVNNPSLLEESQEYVVFHSDSKIQSPNMSVHRTDFHPEHSPSSPREESKQSPRQISEKTPSKSIERRGLHTRTQLTSSIEKKDVEDPAHQAEPMYSDENSDSSGDLLTNDFDIKKMVPYDQRKEEGADPLPPNNKKLNILYDELEDSGSEGSGAVNQESPDHLASIIEEEEEATEYQRSRSRSKSGAISPIPDGSRSGINPRSVIDQRSDEKPLFTNQAKEKLEKVEMKVTPTKEVKNAVKDKKKPKTTKVGQRDTYLRGAKSDKGKPISKPASSQRGRASSKSKPQDILSDVNPSKKKNTNNLDLPPVLEDVEVKSMKNPDTQQKEEKAISMQAQPSAIPEREFEAESSVKLDEPSQETAAPKPDRARERKMRSPTSSKFGGKRAESEKPSGPAWHGPKHVKMLINILNELGDDKSIIYSEFLHFYLIVHEIAINNRIGSVRTIETPLQKLRRNSGKPEANIPHFLWAFMNPNRNETLKKKVVKDIVKSCHDDNPKGRKVLLDSLEETIRANEQDEANTHKNIRLTFNYPGTKRALINFANTICKIDSRLAMARDVNTFISNSVKETFLFENMCFNDPIQGIETTPRQQFDNSDASGGIDPQYVIHQNTTSQQMPTHPNNGEYVAISRVPVQYSSPGGYQQKANRYDRVEHSDSIHADPDLIPSARLDLQNDEVNMASSSKRPISKQNVNNQKRNKNAFRINQSVEKLMDLYQDDLEYNLQRSEHAYTENPTKSSAQKMNVVNFSDNRNMQSQINRYQENSGANSNRYKHESNNSQDWNGSLQYKKPIGASRDLTPTGKNREVAKSQQLHKNVFSLRKQDPTYSRRKARDTTPKVSKNNVIIEEPESKKKPTNRRNKSKTVKKREESEEERNVIGSDSEYEYVKVKKSDKKAHRYAEASEERKPAPKKKVTPIKSKYASKSKSKTTKRKTRYDQDLEGQYEKSRSRSKSHNRDRPSNKNKMELPDDFEKSPTLQKKVLFQVDINMDSKIVRIAIHKGDNVERIVEKFDGIFNLKPKQRKVLTESLKAQYEDMIAKENY